MVNKWIGIGNLGQDPEVRQTPGGQSVATLRLACNEKIKDKDGNWSDRTEWVTVVCWGRTAENVGKFCQKGKQLYIEGRLSTRKWTDKDGKDRYSTEVVANDVKFLGGGGQRDGGQERGGYSGGGGGQRSDPAPQQPTGGGDFPDDDSIPF